MIKKYNSSFSYDNFSLKVEKEFALISAFVLLINLFLEAYYFVFISNHFNYLGFKLDFSIVKYLETKLLLFLFFIYSLHLFKKSSFIYSIFVLLVILFYIPISILYSFMDSIGDPIYSVTFFLTIYTLIAPKKINIKTICLSAQNKFLILFGMALILVIPIFLNFGWNINLKTLFFNEIYETRALFSKNLSTIQDYFYSWEVKIIIPILLIFLLIHQKYLLALLTFSILLYLYMISGNKSVYASTIVVLFFYFFGQDFSTKTRYFLQLLFFGLILIPLVDIYYIKNVFFSGIFVMRVFFFPSLLTYCYFDYFSNFSLYLSEHSFFNVFFQSPLEMKSALLISKVYFNTNDMYANNGIISDGYMNMGYIGVLMFSVVFSSIFLFFNSIRIDPRYYGIFFISIFFLLSIPFFTVLISGGLWLLIILSFFIMQKRI